VILIRTDVYLHNKIFQLVAVAFPNFISETVIADQFFGATRARVIGDNSAENAKTDSASHPSASITMMLPRRLLAVMIGVCYCWSSYGDYS
jgi:hypothetical protein